MEFFVRLNFLIEFIKVQSELEPIQRVTPSGVNPCNPAQAGGWERKRATDCHPISHG